ncbi:HEAT repeat protein [Murinocardiopsis flavida]|uniref:HEAT repeat protein n=1 Tax=Murinocardiopsis flavida TaxID=645275 RepID=A0A2P8DNM1_9ACTN|nr:HEAT repeat domain-containing protein [Murinocardiopsis flavida]PSK98825.1 HEAT repeat protein [Murinocardiopsis flavida]
MTTQENDAFRDAVRRADVAWHAGGLDALRRRPGSFGRLLRHDDPRVRYLGLVRLGERTASALDPVEAAELAALLPDRLPGPPEEALVLAGLYERLGRHVARPWPSWRTAGLPVRVQIAWLRAEIHDDPATVRREPPGELLYQAVRGIEGAAAHRLPDLVAELAAGGDPVLRAEVPRLARHGLHAGLLAPAVVRRHLTDLLGSADAEVAAAALGELAEPWAALDPLPSARMSRFLTAESASDHPEAADTALTAAVRHGHSGVLRDAIGEPGLPPGLRRRALELLGDLAGRGDIGEVTAIAAEDPLLFGAAAVTCLRGLHRRGHFPDDGDVPPIVALALADHSIPPRDVATVLFTCRHALFSTLTDAPPGDPHWRRRLALLVALARQGTGDVPIGDAVTRMLPLAPDPGPFLAAIRDLRHTGAEDAVLAVLPAAPEGALAALEAVGGPATAAALRDGLGLTAAQGAGPIAPHLRAVRTGALALLWQLTEDPGERRAIVARLDPGDLPAAVAADLGGPDAHEVALLTAHLDPDEPVAALRRLAAHGGAAELPTIADLLLRIASEAAAAAEPGAAETRGASPQAEPEVPEEVLDAVRAMGRRLHERARIRPSCLLDAANAQEAGDALAATLALDLLDRPGLSSGEQAVLLGLLLRVPSQRTRARVHRLLRHRDRHVRKRAIALLARDTSGDDARALSASAIALTAARDVPTVRQALLALGRARAHWAAGAITACLDHPNMNVKKTAATVLADTGTPAAVPALLAWLGRHDNPGLRAGLTAALRAVLGGAFAGTLLAAAEHADGRARDLLLAGLCGALPARSLLALHDQGSPVAPALLALAADGTVRLAEGTVADLAPALAAHGIPAPDGAPRPADAADADLRALTATGWDPEAALRVARRAEAPPPDRLAELRPRLADWLALAAATPGDRHRLLRFALLVCPDPWTAAEIAAFARHTDALLAALAAASGDDRDPLLAVLEAVAPTLPPQWTPAIAGAVRALPDAPAGHRSALALLRRAGAVLRRPDVEQALAAARLGANPWQAQPAVLREAFDAPGPPSGAEAESWCAALADAVGTPRRLAAFRRDSGGAVGARERLGALADAYPAAPDGVRAALLDWMTALQPLDAPQWTITETARTTEEPRRGVRPDSIDQPRSAGQRRRLLRLLDAAEPARRDAAAVVLLRWPEPENRLPVLRAFLRGRVAVRGTTALAAPLASVSDAELRGGEVRHDRAAEVAAGLGPQDLARRVPLLLEWWEADPPDIRTAIERALAAVPADALALHLADRIEAGAWGVLDLLAGRPLLRTPVLERACRRLREEGRADLADRLRIVEGPVRAPGSPVRDTAALVAPRERAEGAPHRPSRRELLGLARTGSPEQIRRALNRIAEEHPGSGADHDPGLRDLIEELLHHAKPKVRLHAHRVSRALLDRNTYLGHTEVLLGDPQPDVVRSAVRVLSHAAWEPAIPAIAGLLEHPHHVVRKAAADGLALMGAPAVPVLTHTAARARPDRRPVYTDVLDRIAADGPGSG